ncbi:thioredoxin domain-containing protein [Desulfovibrio sp.]|uniref:thioredoxin family protein n=1 Tax=Desulfovibrio sp. TaxID=885 RepID=UPI0025C1D89A|nr:thioredoxin domain-containing protein [Desulfovibrio sp.]
MMIIVDKENFEAEVQQSAMPCVVDLWGPQCGPCLALMPAVEELAAAYEGKVKFCKLNVAENRRLVISLRVMAVPTILFYKGGECVARLTGDAVSIESIKAETDKLL